MKYLIPFVVFAALSVFLWKGLSLKPEILPSALVGRSIPSFSLPTVEDPTVLREENIFKNHVTLLNFWASWCASCIEEHAFWVTLKEKGKGKGKERRIVRLVGVNYHDEYTAAKTWLHTHGNPFILTLFDKEGRLGLDFGVYGTPETFVIDKKGIIQYRHVGPVNQQVWDAKILPLIQRLEHE